MALGSWGMAKRLWLRVLERGCEVRKHLYIHARLCSDFHTNSLGQDLSNALQRTVPENMQKGS